MASSAATEELFRLNPDVYKNPSPNSDLIAAASNPDHTIKLYLRNDTLDTLTYCAELRGHTGPIHDVVFGRSHEHPYILTSASEDGYIASWDVRSGKNIMNFVSQTHQGKMYSCDILGNTVIGGGENGLYFYDIRKGSLMSFSDSVHTDEVTQVRFHPTNSNLVFSGSEDMLINVYDLSLGPLNSLEDLIDNTLPTEQPVSKFGFFGDQHEYLWAISPIETLSLWNIDECEQIAKYNDIRPRINEAVSSALNFDFDTFNMEAMDETPEECDGTMDEFVPASFEMDQLTLETTSSGFTELQAEKVNGCNIFSYSISPEFSTDLTQSLEKQHNASLSLHPSAWRVDNLIRCIYAPESKTLRLVTGTIGGGLILSNISPQNISPFCILPPNACHKTRVRDVVWNGESDSLLSCGQDSRIGLWIPSEKQSTDDNTSTSALKTTSSRPRPRAARTGTGVPYSRQ